MKQKTIIAMNLPIGGGLIIGPRQQAPFIHSPILHFPLIHLPVYSIGRGHVVGGLISTQHAPSMHVPILHRPPRHLPVYNMLLGHFGVIIMLLLQQRPFIHVYPAGHRLGGQRGPEI